MGPNNISIEMIERLEHFGIDVVTLLMNEIYVSGDIPDDLRKSILIAFYLRNQVLPNVNYIVPCR